jgi:hypothetical protein
MSRYANVCCATTLKNRRCKKYKIGDTDFCTVHTLETCAICYDDLNHGHGKKLRNCGHRFCHSCINIWLINQPTCPCCRSNVDILEVHGAYGYGRSLNLTTECYVVTYDLSDFELNDIGYLLAGTGLYTVPLHFPVTIFSQPVTDTFFETVNSDVALSKLFGMAKVSKRVEFVKVSDNVPKIVHAFMFFKN